VPNRGPVDFRAVARNQFTVVPSRLAATARGYFANRSAFTREIEADDVRERKSYHPGR
jgi:hypothetical protein